MTIFQDGPRSPLFSPLSFKGNTTFERMAESGISEAMSAAKANAPKGNCVAWGIPFVIDEIVIIKEKSFSISLDPIKAQWLIFMHTWDPPEMEPGAGDFFTSMKGPGQLGVTAAEYIIKYTDGSEEQVKIQGRHQIGPFQRTWGENCFQAVTHNKPRAVRQSHEQAYLEWGVSQKRIPAVDRSQWDNWLWAWENPFPEKSISSLLFEAGTGTVVISGLAAGQATSLPLRWEPRRKAIIRFPDKLSFFPDLDERGVLQQIQLDLGQIISASPRQIYPIDTWDQSYNNQIPSLSDCDVLIEYTAHPDAQFHLWDGRLLPVAQIQNVTSRSPLISVASSAHMVKLKVIDRGNGKTVPVKLHIHGEAGEYLPPVDRHRIPNPTWFEDYSVDFSHLGMHYCSYIPGETNVRLPLGNVFIEVSKGFEIRPIRKVVEVTPETKEILIEIEKVLPWREKGWVTADTHVHFLSPSTALLEGEAEGVNIINLLASQWGELMTNVGDFDGRTTWGSKENGGSGEYLVRVGTENRQHVLGHISLLGYQGNIIAPMATGGVDEAALGDPVEILLTEWARQCKKQNGLVIAPHFPDPRGEIAASIISGDVDGVEMTSWGDLYSGISPYSLSDWYRYLNCGYLIAAVGGTDKMTAATAVGTIRTYARIQADLPFTYQSWIEAVQRAETFVSYGPLLDFAVEGKPMGSQIEMSATGGKVDIIWQAASTTIPMSRVELIVNGEICESLAVSPFEASGNWSVDVKKSSWLALLVRGNYPGKLEIITAHSSPVMVRVDNSPMFAGADALTILEQIEGAMAYLDTVGTRTEENAYKRMRLVLESTHRTLHNRMHQISVYHQHNPITDHHTD